MAKKQSPMATLHAWWGCHAQQCASARPFASLPPACQEVHAAQVRDGCLGDRDVCVHGLAVQAERVGYVNGWRAPPARCRPPLAAAQRRPGRHPKALATCKPHEVVDEVG
ncbi:hypothetical protein HaLaN_25027 [Haematococcus lacustris]|uniref:Uncharacterized protein n=1 Tax=Haematococcus lacustris TaxID=44745 RepID=A0A6A0A3J5_HAELA|nr:hypothetical protein HaLaN_25027 [Haematococcus lacustris]